jgi:plasmid stabilization system protein ParE
MRRVLFLEEAVQEGEEAAGWYEAQREGLGREFRGAFSRSIEMLGEGLVTGSPRPGVLGKRGVRRTGRFPYHVALVIGHPGVTVLAIAHQAGVRVTGVAGSNSCGKSAEMTLAPLPPRAFF